jgi:hypothetical protein
MRDLKKRIENIICHQCNIADLEMSCDMDGGQECNLRANSVAEILALVHQPLTLLSDEEICKTCRHWVNDFCPRAERKDPEECDTFKTARNAVHAQLNKDKGV